MKLRTLATTLLAAVGIFALMGDSATAGKGTAGVITVNRAITLSIQNLGPDTSRYYGVITHSPATVDIVAKAKVKGGLKKVAGAAKAKVKKAPRKQQDKAAALVQEFCNQFTKSSQNPVRVTHVPPPPQSQFLIGLGPVDAFFGYSVTGARAPRNDVIRADQSGKDIGSGNTVVRTGAWTWNGNCGTALQALTSMP
jgi:hypothetical protein